MAPQISSSTPSRVSVLTRLPADRSCSIRQPTVLCSTSTRRSRLATSKTGETRPAQIGTATLIADFRSNLSANSAASGDGAELSDRECLVRISELWLSVLWRRSLQYQQACLGNLPRHSSVAAEAPVALGEFHAQRLGLAEQGAGVDAQLLGSGPAVAAVAAQGIGDQDRLH